MSDTDMGMPTPIQECSALNKNRLFIKREDLLPFSFGGNKARKAILFFQEIDQGDYGSVVTYGSGSSNHCRIVANACAKRKLPCFIICPEEASEATFNSQMMQLLGATISIVPVDQVHETIEAQIEKLERAGQRPYFIPGGGHGSIGTKAYVQCYLEIQQYESEHAVYFDYIFFASGTGTTQAGLICGQLLSGDQRRIVGISIARKNPRGRDVVLDSVRAYMGNRVSEAQIQEATIFLDDYTSGYGKNDKRITETIRKVLKRHGIPLDAVYTGKAFLGMSEYLNTTQITGKTVLFIHTGGTPLFFDALRKGL